MVRRFAQWIRHAPGLRHADPLWNALRKPYRAFLAASARNGVAVRIAGQGVRLDPEFAGVGWESIETEAYRTFASAIRPGDLVFDIGAHIGTYAVIAAQKVGPAGKVVAFEPTAATRSSLERHLAMNGLRDRVVVRESCCSEREGVAEFFIGAEAADAQNSLIPTATAKIVEVAATTVDREAEIFGRAPDVLKIDVEGAEWSVLVGAERTLETRKPALLLSIHPNRLPNGISEASILARLRELEYKSTILARDHEVHVWAV